VHVRLPVTRGRGSPYWKKRAWDRGCSGPGSAAQRLSNPRARRAESGYAVPPADKTPRPEA